MQHLVFWPHAGAWGAGVILPENAHNTHKNKTIHVHVHVK